MQRYWKHIALLGLFASLWWLAPKTAQEGQNPSPKLVLLEFFGRSV